MKRRLDQLLANLGYCSRSEARNWITGGRVSIQEKVVKNHGSKAEPEQVRIDNEPLDHPGGILALLHKPIGVVCSHDEREGPSIYDLFPERWRRRNPVITSVGRLDKDTSGLLLVTDQSQLVHRLTSPKHKVPKIYRASVDRDLDPALIELFAEGTLQLEGEKTPLAPAHLVIRESRIAELTLIEGKYHQVRRMFASQGWNVESLHRKRFGDLTLDDLAPGEWHEIPLSTFDHKQG